ncbi:MAG: hypothetical protein U0N06_08635, partial [Faecalibacterium prausnitzii]
MNLPSIPKSFFNGDCFDAYRILGAHPWQGDRGEEGWRFAVWAPGATVDNHGAGNATITQWSNQEKPKLAYEESSGFYYVDVQSSEWTGFQFVDAGSDEKAAP